MLMIKKEIRNKLKPFILRRMKTEVAKDLPPRTEVILFNELAEEERKIYTLLEEKTKRIMLPRSYCIFSFNMQFIFLQVYQKN